MWEKIKSWWNTKQIVLEHGPHSGRILSINKNTKYLYFPYHHKRGFGPSKKFQHMYVVHGKRAIYYGVERIYEL